MQNMSTKAPINLHPQGTNSLPTGGADGFVSLCTITTLVICSGSSVSGFQTDVATRMPGGQ